MVKEIHDSRASTILCNFLMSNKFKKAFLIPSNVCPTIPLSFIKSGVDYEFIDINPNSHAIDIDILLSKLNTSKYNGVLFVHSYGKDFDINNIYKEIKSISQDLAIIDDRCLCIPTFNKVNSFADLTLYSTGYSKYVDLGYGGFAYLNTNFRYIKNRWTYDSIAENKLINDIKDALDESVIIQIKDTNWLSYGDFLFDKYKADIESKLDIISEHKKFINDIYSSSLDKELCWDYDYQKWRFNIRIKPEKRDNLVKKIFENNLFVGTNYPSLSYLFKGINSKNAEAEAKTVINLFNNHKADEFYAEKIVGVINKFLKQSYV